MESITQPAPPLLQAPLQQGQVPQMPQQMPPGMGAPQTIEIKDIHLPENVSDFPVAMGWWIVAALIIATLLAAIIKFKTHQKQSKNKKLAMAQLEKSANVGESLKIIKWAVMQYYPRSQTAQLFGGQFQTFLSEQMKTKHQQKFIDLSKSTFDNLYQQDQLTKVDHEFNQACMLWLKTSLPPNTSSNQGVKV